MISRTASIGSRRSLGSLSKYSSTVVAVLFIRQGSPKCAENTTAVRVRQAVRIRHHCALLWRWSWVVGLTARRLCADMVRELCASEVARGALIDFRQHCGVPFQPFRNEPVIDVLLPLFQIGSLHRVLDDVEEEHVVVSHGPRFYRAGSLPKPD